MGVYEGISLGSGLMLLCRILFKSIKNCGHLAQADHTIFESVHFLTYCRQLCLFNNPSNLSAWPMITWIDRTLDPCNKVFRWMRWSDKQIKGHQGSMDRLSKAYVRGYTPQNCAKYGLIWYSTSILGSWNSQWSMDRLSILGKCWISLRIACLQAHHEHEVLSSVISCHTHITPYHRNPIWLVVYLPLWKMMEFVNGKDDIPYIMEK